MQFSHFSANAVAELYRRRNDDANLLSSTLCFRWRANHGIIHFNKRDKCLARRGFLYKILNDAQAAIVNVRVPYVFWLA